MKIKGVCIHHEAGPLGAAVPDQVLERRLRILKEMGVNAIRTSHNPPAPGAAGPVRPAGTAGQGRGVRRVHAGQEQVGQRPQRGPAQPVRLCGAV